MQYVREDIEFEGKLFALHRWKPDISNYKGMIQIIHGIAEDLSRYEEFVDYFTDKGYTVFGIDQLGHGETVELNNGKLGYFGKKDGWIKVVNSNKYISKLMKVDNPNIPLIIYGHSMGSIIARYYLIGEKIPNGIILTGAFAYQDFTMDFAKVMAKIEKAMKKEDSENVIDNYILDLIYNRKFDSNVKNSWISSLKAEVNKYNTTEKYGFKLTNQMFIDIFEGLKTIERKEKNSEISKDIPLFIISGSEDPVSNFGKDIKKLFNRYKEIDVKDIKYKIYRALRHEVIRDKRNDAVYLDLENWINNHI